MDNEKSPGAASEGDKPEMLDASGLYCPEPVMLLHNKIRDIGAGECLELKATDPSTSRDVPKFCLYLGHELLESWQDGDLYFYRIRKKVDG
jgi:tRNA 2-thiouridine synthesizing protein A